MKFTNATDLNKNENPSTGQKDTPIANVLLGDAMSRIYFAKIFDIAMICEIERDGRKFRPYIAIIASGKLLKDLHEYFKLNLSDIYVQYNKNNRRIFVRAIKNTKPLLEHIMPYLSYKKEIAEKLNEYLTYRILEKEKGMGKYSDVDLKYYEEMVDLAGRGEWD